MRSLLVSAAALALIAAAGSAAAQTAQDPTAQPQDQSQGVQPDTVEETPQSELSFYFGVTSDYVFGGVSQSEEDPAVFGGADLTYRNTYVGVWASNVSFPGDEDTNAEIDVYGGFRPQVGGFTFDIGAIGYLYTNQPNGADYDYLELKVGASRTYGELTLGALAFYSPDYFGASEDEATYVEVNAAYAISDRLTASAGLGRQYLSSDFDYTTWNAGATFALTDRFGLDVRYHDTDEHEFGEIYDSRLVASLKATF